MFLCIRSPMEVLVDRDFTLSDLQYSTTVVRNIRMGLCLTVGSAAHALLY